MNFSSLFESIDSRAATSSPVGDFLPTGIILTGGTANRVGRFLVDRLRSSGAAQIPILAIDTDSRENEKYSELPPLVAPDQLVLLSPEVAVRALAKAQERHPSQAHIIEYLPDVIDGESGIHSTTKVKIATGHGAGQFRRAGKLLLNTNVGSAGAGLKARLERFRAELIGARARQAKLQTVGRFNNRTKIYVVSSLSGGTGSGSIIDLLALVRLIFPEASHEVDLIAVLPGEALDRELKNKEEIAVTRANAIATLMELQGIRTGKLVPFTAKFDHEHQVTIRDGANFANQVFLVDTALSSGNPVTNYLSVCRAVANYLYCQINTGVGAAGASAAVNVLDARIVDGQPHNFSTFGVSYLEFPAQYLRRYTVLTAVGAWIERWTTPSTGSDEAKAADRMLIELAMANADDWRATYHRALAVDDYAVLGERREKLLRVFDSRFFAETQKLRRRLGDDLHEYVGRLPAVEADLTRDRLSVLDRNLASLYAANVGDALDLFSELTERLTGLKTTLTGEGEFISRSRKALENELMDLEKAIRRNDLPPPFSDRPERDRYLRNLKHLADLEVAATTLASRLALIQAVEQRAGGIENGLRNLHADLRREREDIAAECNRIEGTAGPDELGAWVLSSSDFPTWKAKLTKDVNVSLPVDASIPPAAAAVVAHLITAFDKPVWEAISKIDVAELAKGSDPVQRRMRALAEMARPLMQFVPTAPLESELLPQSFVAGNLPDQTAGKEFVESMVPALRGSNWEPVNTANPHLLLYVNVRRGFAATHWHGFENANRIYLRQRAKHHTLANWQAVPTLHQTSRDEEEAQLTFGLGLFSELIRRRGSNYHWNVERVANGNGKGRLKFATFTKERGPAGHALVEHGLLEEAMASERMPNDSLLGNSLEAAVTALRQPVFAEASVSIRSAVDELGRTKIGYVELKRLIMNWIETQLVPEIGKATTRRDLLQTIAERLKAYSESLGKQV